MALSAVAGPEGGAVPAHPAQEAGRFTWEVDDPRFGGLSALEITDDGAGFVALTDRGTLVQGRIERDARGRIAAVEDARLRPLRGPDGQPVRGHAADPEGLAVAPHGQLFVSFEGQHRVWSYAAPETSADALPQHPDFGRLQNNSGLEALAIDGAGRLLTLPERSGALDRPFPVYRYEDGAWSQPFDLPRDGPYLPVGLDVGPDGRLYLLERNFRGLRGFDARVSRFTLHDDTPGPREVLVETGAPFQNNFEGIAVWPGPDGALRLTLISDDNFSFPLTSEIVEYRLAR